MNLININKSNEYIKKDIDQIINEKNIEIKSKYINLLYNMMVFSNEITIKYKIEKEQSHIRIFGDEFVYINKKNCVIIYDNEINELEPFFYFYNKKAIKIENDILTIKLKIINEMKDMRYMFSECTSLLKLPDISKIDTSKIINMECMFNNCTSLLSLPDISNWNTSNVTNMAYMFNNCSSLLSLPNISSWNTSNLIYINGIFDNCSSLKSLPDISKWNIKKKNIENIKVKIKKNYLREKDLLLPHLIKIRTCLIRRRNFKNGFIDGKYFQNINYGVEGIEYKIKNMDDILEYDIKFDEENKDDDISELLYSSDKFKKIMKQKYIIPEYSPINKLLKSSEYLSNMIFSNISKLNVEKLISFKNLEVNILLDCSISITDNEKYFVIFQVCSIVTVFHSLGIPYLISLVGDNNFKVVLKELNEKHSIDILQKALDCIFIKRNSINMFSCIKTAINKFKILGENSHRAFIMFTNGVDDEFFFHEKEIHNLFINQNHSFLFILSKNKNLNHECQYTLNRFWNRFSEYCKSNNLNVEFIEMSDINELKIKIFDYIQVFLNIFNRNKYQDNNEETFKAVFEINQCKNIPLDYELINLIKNICDDSLKKIKNEPFVKNKEFPKSKETIPKLNQNEYEELLKNLGSIIKLHIPLKDEEKSLFSKLMRIFKTKIEKKNLSSLELILRPKLSDNNIQLTRNEFKNNELNKKKYYSRITIIIDSSISCFSSLCFQHTLNTIQILLSALSEIDLPYFNLIVSGETNPYIICSEKNTIDVLSEKSQIWPILFNIFNQDIAKANLTSAIRAAYNLHNLRKNETKSPEYLFILTDGFFSLNERKRIVENINFCIKEEINVLGIGVGIAPIGIENLFPNTIYSVNPDSLIQSIVSCFTWRFGNDKDNYIERYICLHILDFKNIINDEDIEYCKKNPIYKELKDELINIPVPVVCFK